MLWWLLNGIISYIRGNSEKTAVHSYILKALHYLILMPVVVSFVSLKSNEGKIGSNSEWLYITIALAVTAAYLFGKIQKRQRINRFRQSLNMVFNKSIAPFNFKAELIISIIALVYLLAIFFVPIFVIKILDFYSVAMGAYE